MCNQCIKHDDKSNEFKSNQLSFRKIDEQLHTPGFSLVTLLKAEGLESWSLSFYGE